MFTVTHIKRSKATHQGILHDGVTFVARLEDDPACYHMTVTRGVTPYGTSCNRRFFVAANGTTSLIECVVGDAVEDVEGWERIASFPYHLYAISEVEYMCAVGAILEYCKRPQFTITHLHYLRGEVKFVARRPADPACYTLTITCNNEEPNGITHEGRFFVIANETTSMIECEISDDMPNVEGWETVAYDSLTFRIPMSAYGISFVEFLCAVGAIVTVL
jgi:hypothetical protein